MEGKKMTRNVLVAATLVVMTFVGLNVYTYANGSALESTMNAGTQMTIPVKGMTCATCEMAVKSAVKKLPGIYDVRASARGEIARVAYDPEKTSLDEIIAAINETGYMAEKPKL